MATMTEDIRKTRFYAGLYLRTKRQMRFWGWGSASQKKFAAAQSTETKRPWAGLAEWLRVAHSLLDGNCGAAVPSPTQRINSAKR